MILCTKDSLSCILFYTVISPENIQHNCTRRFLCVKSRDKQKNFEPGWVFSFFSSFHSQLVGVFWNLSTDLLSVVEEFAEHKVSDYMLKRRSKQKRFSEYISYSNPIGWSLQLMESSIISLQSYLFLHFHVSDHWLKLLIYFQKKTQTQQFLSVCLFSERNPIFALTPESTTCLDSYSLTKYSVQ